MANDMTRIELTAARRGLVRDAIKAHPEWPRYREQYDTDMSQMTTKEAIGKCCDGLGIDIAEVIAGAYVPIDPVPAQPAPKSKRTRPSPADGFVPIGDGAAKLAPIAPAPGKAAAAVESAVAAYVREASGALLSDAALREEIERRLAAIETGAKAFAANLLAETYAGVIEDLIAKGFRTALTNAARYFKSDEG